MSAKSAGKELISRMHDALERGDLDDAVSCWGEDAVNHASGRAAVPLMQGRAALRRVFEALRLAFPDRRWTVDEMIEEGDLITCRLTVSGTFGQRPPPPPGPLPKPWLGVESTQLLPDTAAGRPYSVSHIHIFRVRDGLISEHWAARDDLGLLLQLGAIQPPD